MRLAVVILAALVVAGAIWLGVSARGESGVQITANEEPPAGIVGDDADTFTPPATVCSMDPRFRPAAGQRTCRASP